MTTWNKIVKYIFFPISIIVMLVSFSTTIVDWFLLRKYEKTKMKIKAQSEKLSKTSVTYAEAFAKASNEVINEEEENKKNKEEK